MRRPAETKDVFKTLTGKKVSEFEQGALVDVSSEVDGKTSAEISESALSWFTGKLPYLPVGAPVVVKARANDGTEISVNTTVQDSDSVYMSARGLYVSVDAVFQRADSFGSALSFGVSKTIESAAQVFIFLKNVGKNVSAKALGGPGMIVGTAYEAAGRKDGVFLLFLCLISANLAVVNFLPIPVLDGGHMVFLLYEAIMDVHFVLTLLYLMMMEKLISLSNTKVSNTMNQVLNLVVKKDFTNSNIMITRKDASALYMIFD